MPDPRLLDLMHAGALPPLCYYFARFVARGSGSDPDGVLAQSAALTSLRNLGGDVCVDLARFAGRPLFEVAAGAAILAPQAPALHVWISALSASPWVGEPGGPEPLILDGTRLYLGKYWGFEQGVATALARRMTWVEGIDPQHLSKGLDRLFPAPAPGTVDWQRVAAAITIGRRFAVVSGGPGTGKTTTVVKVLALLLDQDPALRIAMAAPTGKAAARLGEAVRRGKSTIDAPAAILAQIPEQATTIHRLLGLRRGQAPRHHAGNPLLLDCLVVDEASMIDLPLMARLLAALPAQTRLILLGDRDQLASVEAGNVLGDITGHGRELGMSPAQVAWLESIGALPAGQLQGDPAAPPAADCVGLLRHSYRFRAEGGIGGLARAVNAGDGGEALRLLRESDQPGMAEVAWQDTEDGRPGPRLYRLGRGALRGLSDPDPGRGGPETVRADPGPGRPAPGTLRGRDPQPPHRRTTPGARAHRGRRRIPRQAGNGDHQRLRGWALQWGHRAPLAGRRRGPAGLVWPRRGGAWGGRP